MRIATGEWQARGGGKFDVDAIRDGSAEDPVIRNGDVIVVGHSGTPYGPAPEETGDFGLDLREYWRIFVKRKWLIASLLVAAVMIGGVRSLMMTPLYTATARIQIDRDTPNIVDKGKVESASDLYDYDFMKTQVEVLQSRAIAERVAWRGD